MAKLNQIIAVSKGVKSQTLRSLTDAHRDVQKQPLLSGISRTYQARDDEGERLPAESTKVQLTATGVIEDVKASLSRLFDVVATLDTANTHAKADVVVDGVMLVADAPVTYLLFLEKQLTDLQTFVAKLPTLDPSENWTFNEAAGPLRGRSGADDAIEEDPAQPCEGRGHREASGPGRGIQRRRHRRDLDDAEVFRRAAGHRRPRDASSRNEGAGGSEVRA